MTTLTLLRGGLIEKDFLALDQPDLFVTAIASDIPVKPLQREGGPLVMIEQRWLPLRAVMAVHACRGSILRELPAMCVLVAILTLGRSSREVSRDQLGLHIGRLVAIDTGSRPVRAHQGERSFRVVEPRQPLPCLRRVASFAARRCSICARLLHPLRKLTLVRILVAGLAGQILPVIEDDRLRCPLCVRRLFMAVATRHGHMPARQQELRFFVPHERERRRLIPLKSMAARAVVQIRSGRELSVVFVFMAVGAALERDLE